MIRDNVSEFLGVYNDLEEALSKKLNYHGNRDFSTYLYWAKENKDEIIMRYFDELNSIREFRNILTHESTSNMYPIANPNPELIERVKFLIDVIGNYKTAKDLFLKEVKSLRIDDTLKFALENINALGYTQYPVFDKNRLVGIVTENGITNFLAFVSANGYEKLNHALIEDVLEVDSGKNHFEIISGDTSIFQVEDMFHKEIKKGNSAFVILISKIKNPKNPKDILGIITPWDVPTLLEYM